MAGRHELERAAAVVGELLGVGSDQKEQRLLARYPHVRRFLPALLRRIRFAAVPPGHPVLAALDYLRSLEDGTATERPPTAVITEGWRPLVIAHGTVDRRAYTFCVLDRLRLALRRRDVYVVAADRWGDPRRLLVAPDVWKSVGPEVLRTLALPPRAPPIYRAPRRRARRRLLSRPQRRSRRTRRCGSTRTGSETASTSPTSTG